MTQGVNYLVVPILIREDDCVRLHFPRDITMAEAEKVSRVILAYAIAAPSDSGRHPSGASHD